MAIPRAPATNVMRPSSAAEYKPATTSRLTNAGPKGATASAPSPIANGSVTTAVIVPARTLRFGSALTLAGKWKDVHGEGAAGERKMRDSRLTGSALPSAAEVSVASGSGFIDRSYNTGDLNPRGTTWR